MSDRLNYFTCTLGQAALLRQSKPYQDIPAFIDYQAEHYPDLPAAGCYDVGPHLVAWQHHVLTFANVQRCSQRVARQVRDVINLPRGETIALLWPSSVEFLFIWLGLVYSGHPVLLIAPQCSASAIASLCKATDVSTIVSHDSYSQLVADALAEAAGSGYELKSLRRLPQIHVPGLLDEDPTEPIHRASVASTDVAYLHHTSGTSSGTPKPIPQTHDGGLVVLPRLDGKDAATFTTTPLYHGGIADLFRAWTSNGLIWLFPGADVPITASNVVRCLDVAEAAHSAGGAPAVRYFSSVPYVLQMLAAEETGLQHLKKMQMVGVGGAALPVEVGDDLVRHDVRLVSRYGSAECGFLLSSHRKYDSDNEWQYLRCDTAVEMLHFEERESCSYELVIGKTWPHMAKRNREDGSYATSDLFERHPSIENAWRYHSRADSQLTLLTGKKFDPAPLEAAIVAGSSLIADALIFGEGQSYPGVLLFRTPNAKDAPNNEIKDQLRPLIQRLNVDSQSHARIPLGMLIPMPPTVLEKSSKGTVLRSIVMGRFSQEIEAAYAGSDNSLHNVPNADLTATILGVVSSVMVLESGGLTPETDLFAYGIDSVASMQIRSKLTQLLSTAVKLPLTVVQDCGTVGHLSEYILALRRGLRPKAFGSVKQEDVYEQMQRMVREHCVLLGPNEPHIPAEAAATPDASNGPSSESHTILMTGPTGTLGAHLLHHLLTHATVLNIAHIYLLVRGSSTHAAQSRVHKALTNRSLPIPSSFSTLTTSLPCTLSHPTLGLDAHTYATLATHTTHIYHLAWHVNFLAPLSAFTSHLASIRNLLHLLQPGTRDRDPATPPPHFIFCSSTASVARAAAPIPERLLPIADPSVAGATSYARSKWAAEQLCGFFATQQLPQLDQNVRVDVVRVGQLAGSTATGCWARSEAYPLMLSASRLLGEAPDLDEAVAVRNESTVSSSGGGSEESGKKGGGEECAWIPVDVAAAAFVELGFGAASSSAGRADATGASQVTSDGVNDLLPTQSAVNVFHLLPQPTAHGHATWCNVLTTILQTEPDAFRVVPVRRWLDALEGLRERVSEHKGGSGIKTGPGNARGRMGQEHPALQLVGFWREAYCAGRDSDSGGKVIEGAGEGFKRPMEGERETTVARPQTDDDQADSSVHGKPDTTSGFEMSKSVQAMPVLGARPAAVHLDPGYIAKCWQWIKDNV